MAVAALVVPTLLIVAQRVIRGAFGYDKWTDRDLVRAARFFTDWPMSGAELSYGDGGRIPGPGLYLLLGPPLWAGGDPVLAWRVAALLDLVGLLVLARTLHRHHGPVAAGAAALLYVTDAVWVRTTLKLWNPTFLPVFVALSIAALYRLRADGRAGGLVGWAAALAVGAQVHLSAALWAAATAPAALTAKVAGKGRAIAGALGVLLLAYAPYLVDEATRGWPNSRLLLRQPELARPGSTIAAGPLRAAGQLVTLLGLVPGDRATAAYLLHHTLPAWLTVAGLVVALVARRLGRTDGAASGARAVAVGVLLVLVGYVVDGSLELSQRYLLVLVPALAALGGVAVDEAVRRAGRGGPVVLAVAVALLLGRAAPALSHLHFSGRPDLDPDSWEGLNGLLDAVAEAVDRPVEHVVGSTIVVRGEGPGRRELRWKADTAIDYLLLERDLTFPGSLPTPPCALVVEPPEAAPTDDAALAAALGPGVGAPVFERAVDLDRERRLVVYRVADGDRCPTSLTQRYLDTGVEAKLHARYDALPTAAAEPLPAPSGTTRHAFALVVPSGAKDAPDARLAVALDLRAEAGALRATLVSPQLRGDAYNTGWFAQGLLHRPRLRLVAATGEARVLAFSDGFVGFRSPATPLTATVPLDGGPWTVTFEAEALPVAHERWPAPDAPRTSISVPITTLAASGG